MISVLASRVTQYLDERPQHTGRVTASLTAHCRSRTLFILSFFCNRQLQVQAHMVQLLAMSSWSSRHDQSRAHKPSQARLSRMPCLLALLVAGISHLMGVCTAELLELDHGSIQFFAVTCAVDLVRFRIRGVAGFLLNQAHLQDCIQQLIKGCANYSLPSLFSSSYA